MKVAGRERLGDFLIPGVTSPGESRSPRWSAGGGGDFGLVVSERRTMIATFWQALGLCST